MGRGGVRKSLTVLSVCQKCGRMRRVPHGYRYMRMICKDCGGILEVEE